MSSILIPCLTKYLLCLRFYGCALFTFLGPYTFSIGDTRDLGEFTKGGVATTCKIPKTFKFVSFVSL